MTVDPPVPALCFHLTLRLISCQTSPHRGVVYTVRLSPVWGETLSTAAARWSQDLCDHAESKRKDFTFQWCSRVFQYRRTYTDKKQLWNKDSISWRLVLSFNSVRTCILINIKGINLALETLLFLQNKDSRKKCSRWWSRVMNLFATMFSDIITFQLICRFSFARMQKLFERGPS